MSVGGFIDEVNYVRKNHKYELYHSLNWCSGCDKEEKTSWETAGITMFPALNTLSPATSHSFHHTLFDITDFVPEIESQNQLLLP